MAFGWGIEPVQLTAALVQGCWPATPLQDEPRTEAWLRELAEHEVRLHPPSCSCDTGGPCLVCN